MRHHARRGRFLSQVRLVRGGVFAYGAAPEMKPLILSCWALGFVALTGCAASSETDDDGTDAAMMAETGPQKDSATNKDTGPNECETIMCTADTDCQAVCPNVPNGTNCCDTSTGKCYAYAQTMCPAPVMDAGFD
jgi:hypothetical protein